MEKADILSKRKFRNEDVNQVTNMKTERIAQTTYYFRPGQMLDYHRHPDGDQIFFVHEGYGVCYTYDGATEEAADLRPGVIVLAPRGVWHKISANTDMIVSAATSQPAGFEKRA